MFRNFIPVLCLVAFVTAAAMPAIAAEASETAGTVVKMDTAASKLTIKTMDGKEMSFTVSAETKVADAKGAAKAFADVKDGAKVKVMAADGAASSITLE